MKGFPFGWISGLLGPSGKGRAIKPVPALAAGIDADHVREKEALEGFEDPGPAIRFGYRIIVLGFGAFIVWAVFAPIDEGVPAQGVVSVESRRKVVSHLTGGTVTSVHVHENQLVEAGSVLLMLDPTRAKANFDNLQNEYVAAAARLARLIAEQNFADRITYPDDLRLLVGQIGREDIFQSQEQLFRVRQEALESEQSILRQTLASSQIQTSEVRQQLAARQQQSALLRQELASNRQLVDEGYAPRNRLLEQERQLADLASSTADIQARIARESSAVAETRLRILQRRQEYLKEVENQGIEARRELASLTERLKDARLELERTTVRAPVTGQVMAMQAQAPGTIVTPGMKLLEIVPQGEKLVLDAQVPVQVASRVSPGMDTFIRFTTFPNIPMLIVPGRVLSLSPDRHEQSPTAPQPYYLARVEVTPEGEAKLGNHHLRPGMTADVIIKTGERSFMAYLMRPFTKQFFSAFKEP